MNGIFLLNANPHLFAGLANSNLLLHLLIHVAEYVDEMILIVHTDQFARVEAWAADKGFSDRTTVWETAGHGELDGLAELAKRNVSLDGEIIVVNDKAVVIAGLDELVELEADYANLGGTAFWFRYGADLTQLLAKSTAASLADALAGSGKPVAEVRPKKHLPVGNPQERLEANSRLLGIGHSSQNALERSYTEEFAVIPPVFIHADAEIYASMIGPYVSIGPGCVVERCVLENCIVEADAELSHLNLVDSIIGRGVTMHGEAETILK